MISGLAQSIGDLVGPLVAAAGLELWDIEHRPGVVRVLVDRAGGVDLETIGYVAKAISDELDAHEDVAPGSHYSLEVSSPGVERTLRTPAHYRQFVGSLLSVKTKEAVDGERRVRGILLVVDDTGITLGPEVAGAEPVEGRQYAYQQIHKAHTVLVWGAVPKASKPRTHAASSLPDTPSVPMKDTAT